MEQIGRDYRKDMPPQVIAFARSFRSVENLGQSLAMIAREVNNFNAIIKPEAFSIFEKAAILFGFEQKPYDIFHSQATLFKNMRITDEEMGLLESNFYSATSPYTAGDIFGVLGYALKDLPVETNTYTFDGRIKQPQSLILKIRKILAQIEGCEPESTLTLPDLLTRTEGHAETIRSSPFDYFEDMVSYKIIINDIGMDGRDRTLALTKHNEMVINMLDPKRQTGEITLTNIRKQGRVPGHEAVNLFIQGWLNHPIYGVLPVKIQFRFLSTLCVETAMYYSYKYYRTWELPPWAQDINFSAVDSFEEVKRLLFANFNEYFQSEEVAPFRIRDYLSPDPSWSIPFDMTFPLK